MIEYCLAFFAYHNIPLSVSVKIVFPDAVCPVTNNPGYTDTPGTSFQIFIPANARLCKKLGIHTHGSRNHNHLDIYSSQVTCVQVLSLNSNLGMK